MGLRLGYLIPEFPSQTHAFFWREITALRRMGETVLLVSTRKPSPIICRHDFVGAAISETHYLFPPAIADLVAWGAGGGPGFRKALAYQNELKPMPIKNHLRSYGLLASAVDLFQWARRERIDHIHVQSCADAAHVVALARHMGGPSYSLTLHGDLSVYGTNHRSKMREAAFVNTVGAHLRSQVLEEAHVPADRVFTTFMGVDTSGLATLGNDRKYKSNILHLVTVARLNPAKGHLYALAAIDRARQSGVDIHYTIAGEGPHRQTIVGHVRDLGLENHVTLAGTLSDTEVFKLLSRADAFVLSSTGVGEAWPVSVMEAMGAGLPVIASLIGATPEMITPDADGFLVPQKDVEAIFERIMLLARNVDARRRIGEAAKQTASRRFDVAVTAAALRDAIYGARLNWMRS